MPEPRERAAFALSHIHLLGSPSLVVLPDLAVGCDIKALSFLVSGYLRYFPLSAIRLDLLPSSSFGSSDSSLEVLGISTRQSDHFGFLFQFANDSCQGPPCRPLKSCARPSHDQGVHSQDLSQESRPGTIESHRSHLPWNCFKDSGNRIDLLSG